VGEPLADARTVRPIPGRDRVELAALRAQRDEIGLLFCACKGRLLAINARHES
jgi:hypothetical protein